MAPTVDPINPVELPGAYHPTACPRKVATKEPATPRAMVIITPPGSFPGMMSLASAPATSPMTRVQMSDMLPPYWWPRTGLTGPKSATDGYESKESSRTLNEPLAKFPTVCENIVERIFKKKALPDGGPF